VKAENGGITKIDKVWTIGLPQQPQWQKGEQEHSSWKVREWFNEIKEVPGESNAVKSLHVSYDKAKMYKLKTMQSSFIEQKYFISYEITWISEIVVNQTLHLHAL